MSNEAGRKNNQNETFRSFQTGSWEIMETIRQLLDYVIHLDEYLMLITQKYGLWTYAISFLVIFAETGFVVTPFLPGDSFLFALGTIAAIGNLNVIYLFLILFAAAIIGDTVNYWVGHKIGHKAYEKNYRLLNREHLDKAHAFYDKYGGKAIFLARFVPIVRTFAPFVAGVGKMNYSYFIFYNVVGGLVWTSLFVFAGYFFGNVPFVKHNFEYVIFGIIGVSLVPIFVEWIKAKKERRTKNNEQ